MFYIDTSTTTGSMPTPGAVGTPGWFQNGNPASGIPYTVTSADWANGITAELINVVLAAGLTPNKAQTNQLATAIGSMITGSPYFPTMPYSVSLNDNGRVLCLGAGGQLTLPTNAPAGFKITVCCYAATIVTVVCGSQQNIAMPLGFTQNYIMMGGEGTVFYYGGDAIWRTFGATPRRVLNSALNLYVSNAAPAGGTGFSSGSALPTPQAAWDLITTSFDTNTFPVTVNVAPGTYPRLVTQGQVLGNGPVTFVGAGLPTITGSSGQDSVSVGAGSTVKLDGFNIAGNSGGGVVVSGVVQITNCTISATGAGHIYASTGAGINVAPGGVCAFLSGNSFGACGFAHISAFSSGVFSCSAPSYTVTGSAPIHINAASSGVASLVGNPTTAISFQNTPAFTSGVINGSSGGTIFLQGVTFTGAVTGPQWIISTCSTLSKGGATIPGTTGSTDSATFGTVY